MGPESYSKPADRLYRPPRTKPWQVVLPAEVRRPRASTITPRVVIYGFVGIITVGAILLTLPIASQLGQLTHPIDALFTATSATCVTGLAVVDTGTYWSFFGQAVILVLIQVGGFGFMISATLILLATGRRIGLRDRLAVGENMGLDRLGGLVRLVRDIAIFTAITEGCGFAVFYARFAATEPGGHAAWKAAFHSISAFNNAGLDIFGNFRSLTGYVTDPAVVLTTVALIFLGGISFLVLQDVVKNHRFSKLSVDSKIVLTVTGVLLALGTFGILAADFSNPATLGTLSPAQKIMASFFQSVTARTAGFGVVDIGRMATTSLILTIFLMFIGGASGSTSGGIKVNTFGVLVATILSAIRGREHVVVFGRELPDRETHQALAVAFLALGLIGVVVIILSITESFGFLPLVFETVSAFGTVGLSTGITPGLSFAGRIIITVVMFIGRLGPLVVATSLIRRHRLDLYRSPQAHVRIG
jgi:trk system potassium uptake protein